MGGEHIVVRQRQSIKLSSLDLVVKRFAIPIDILESLPPFDLRLPDNQDVPLSWAMNAGCELEFYVASFAWACDQHRAAG